MTVLSGFWKYSSSLLCTLPLGHFAGGCASVLCRMPRECVYPFPKSGKHGELVVALPLQISFPLLKEQMHFPFTQTEGIRVGLCHLAFLRSGT